MDFFGHQARANKQTKKLLVLFVITASLIVASLYLFFRVFPTDVFMVSTDRLPDLLEGDMLPYSGQVLTFWDQFTFGLKDFGVFWAIGMFLFSMVSYFKLLSLRSGGGEALALRQGGGFIIPETIDPQRRKLLNIVEEMSIAAGCPMPKVFEMHGDTINAFAAGWQTSDAVIGVTTKAIETLARDEMQAVVAHEFSHVMQGDMRLNMNLIAVVFSIFCIYQAGTVILRSRGRRSRSSSRSAKSDGSLAGVGFGLAAVGYIGYLGAGLIKAGISRQREFFADAAAVQFTRNPEALVSAFAKIQGQGSIVESARGQEISHMFFADGIRKKYSDLWSTHPKLVTRVGRIGEKYLDSFIKKSQTHKEALKQGRPNSYKKTEARKPQNKNSSSEDGNGIAERIIDLATDPAGSGLGSNFLNHMGTLPLYAQQQAEKLKLSDISKDGLEGIYDQQWGTYECRALVMALMLDENHASLDAQWSIVTEYLPVELQKLCRSVQKKLRGSSSRRRLALVDASLGPLKFMTKQQTHKFLSVLKKMVMQDGQIAVFEYTLFAIVQTHLEKNLRIYRRNKPSKPASKPNMGSAKLYALSCLAGECKDPNAAYIDVLKYYNVPLARRSPRKSWNAAEFDAALKVLDTKAYKKKKQFILDMSKLFYKQSTQEDSRILELMRAVCDRLGCPVALIPSHVLSKS